MSQLQPYSNYLWRKNETVGLPIPYKQNTKHFSMKKYYAIPYCPSNNPNDNFRRNCYTTHMKNENRLVWQWGEKINYSRSWQTN